MRLLFAFALAGAALAAAPSHAAGGGFSSATGQALAACVADAVKNDKLNKLPGGGAEIVCGGLTAQNLFNEISPLAQDLERTTEDGFRILERKFGTHEDYASHCMQILRQPDNSLDNRVFCSLTLDTGILAKGL